LDNWRKPENRNYIIPISGPNNPADPICANEVLNGVPGVHNNKFGYPNTKRRMNMPIDHLAKTVEMGMSVKKSDRAG
jgi:hypothetical protein